MNFKKKELIVTIIMLIVFVIIGLGLNAYASSPSVNLVIGGNNSTSGLQIVQNTNSSTVENTNSSTSGTVITNTSTSTNTSNSTNTSMPYTGAGEMPWLIIAICAASAIFAYKKIKEYNVD